MVPSIFLLCCLCMLIPMARAYVEVQSDGLYFDGQKVKRDMAAIGCSICSSSAFDDAGCL